MNLNLDFTKLCNSLTDEVIGRQRHKLKYFVGRLKELNVPEETIDCIMRLPMDNIKMLVRLSEFSDRCE